jgi:hypothetical protein
MEGDDEENGDGNGQEDGDTRAVGPGHHRASVRGAVREGRG